MWAYDNEIRLHDSKTKAILFHFTGYKYRLDNVLGLRIILDDLNINWEDTIKLLGVTLDCSLS